MTLGDRIYQLRTKAGLSQEALAEQTGVSRQSVSKWETNASIPELDKLIQLTKIFGITLDALVNDEPAQTAPETVAGDPAELPANATEQTYILPTAPYEYREKPHSHNAIRKIIGAVLLAVSLICITLALIFPFGFFEWIIILSVYVLLCGIICLTVRKHPGLAIGGLTFVALILFFGVFMSNLMVQTASPDDIEIESVNVETEPISDSNVSEVHSNG